MGQFSDYEVSDERDRDWIRIPHSAIWRRGSHSSATSIKSLRKINMLHIVVNSAYTASG